MPYLIAINMVPVKAKQQLLRGQNNSCSELSLYEPVAYCALHHIYSRLDILLDGLCCNPTVAFGNKALVSV